MAHGQSEEKAEADNEGEQSVQTCEAKEANEVASVSTTDAGTHPRAVVVVDLHAEAAGRAVEGARRAHDLAREARAQHLDSVPVVHCRSLRKYFELPLTEVSLARAETRVLAALVSILAVDHIVRPIVIYLVRLDLWKYPWLCRTAKIEDAHDVCKADDVEDPDRDTTPSCQHERSASHEAAHATD